MLVFLNYWRFVSQLATARKSRISGQLGAVLPVTAARSRSKTMVPDAAYRPRKTRPPRLPLATLSCYARGPLRPGGGYGHGFALAHRLYAYQEAAHPATTPLSISLADYDITIARD